MKVRLRDQGSQGDEHRLEFLPDTSIPLFENFVATQPSEVLVSVFRQILEIVLDKQLKDYHFKVQNGWRGSTWKVVLLHGNPSRDGPIVCSQCISCDLTCPIKLGITGHGQEGKSKHMAAGNFVASMAYTVCFIISAFRTMLCRYSSH